MCLFLSPNITIHTLESVISKLVTCIFKQALLFSREKKSAEKEGFSYEIDVKVTLT